jgi:N-methylhydantoinase A/oxoprolinase/acetone carboxylase beta subunit
LDVPLAELVHGTTLATNALLERTKELPGLITTRASATSCSSLLPRGIGQAGRPHGFGPDRRRPEHPVLRAAHERSSLMSMDMEGTSFDVSLIVDGNAHYTTEFAIEWGRWSTRQDRRWRHSIDGWPVFGDSSTAIRWLRVNGLIEHEDEAGYV